MDNSNLVTFHPVMVSCVSGQWSQSRPTTTSQGAWASLSYTQQMYRHSSVSSLSS